MAEVLQLWVIDEAGLTIPDAGELVTETVRVLREPDELGGEYLFDDDDDATAMVRIFCQQLAKAYALAQVVAASFDPEQAAGVMLRDRGSLVGAEYPARAKSVVPGTLFGAANTIVPKGSMLAFVATGDLWVTPQQYVLGAGGTVAAELESQEYGPVLAPQGPNTDWVIQTPVAGWTSPGGGFVPSADATPGRLAATDPEVREAILLAGRGGAGAATYDADVQNVAAADGVALVQLFVNRTLLFDVVQDLAEKRGRFVVEGGKKQDILDAIVNTESTGLNTTDTGTVVGTSTRFDGKVIVASFSRPLDVRILFRVTLSGPLLPTLAECRLLVNAAVAERMALQDVAEKVVPAQYAAAIVKAFGENVVESCVVEVRRGELDPWQTTPLLLSASLAERAVVRTSPTAAEIFGVQEDPLAVLAGMTLNLSVDGALIPVVVFSADHATAAAVAADIEAQVGADVDALDADGRLLLRSPTLGPTSEIQVAGGTALVALGLVVTQQDEGTDGDVEVVIV